jgi:hypothetical protein
MIGKLELELSSKNMTINYLTQELTKIMTVGGGTLLHTQPTATATATATANDLLMF